MSDNGMLKPNIDHYLDLWEISKFRIPSNLVKDINNVCDARVEDESNPSYRLEYDKFNRHIKNYIDSLIVKYLEVNSKSNPVYNEYLTYIPYILQMWFNDMVANEYNTLHRHTDGCVISLVLFLKVPDLKNSTIGINKKNAYQNFKWPFQMIDKKGSHENRAAGSYGNKGWGDGSLVFIGLKDGINVTQPSSNLLHMVHSVTLDPEVGDLYIFPSDILHMVYPFNCDGMRRSLSMNINF